MKRAWLFVAILATLTWRVMNEMRALGFMLITFCAAPFVLVAIIHKLNIFWSLMSGVGLGLGVCILGAVLIALTGVAAGEGRNDD